MEAKVFDGVNKHIDFHRKAIDELGFNIDCSTDMTAFRHIRLSFGGYAHPTLDDTLNAFDSDNAFWVGLVVAGRYVAAAAGRVYPIESLVHLIQSRRLWRNACLTPAAIAAPVGTDIDALAPVYGRLAIHGGLIVDPAFRGGKIGIHLIRLIRAMSFRHWFEDWHFGLITQKTLDSGIHRTLYGYHREARAFNAAMSWGPRNPVEWVNYSSRSEMAAEYLTDPDPVKFLRRTAAIDTTWSATGSRTRVKKAPCAEPVAAQTTSVH